MALDPRIFTDQSQAQNFVGILNLDPPRTFPNTRGGNVVQDIQKYQDQQNMITTLQFPHDRAKFFFLISLAFYSRDSLTSVRANLNTVSNIILPVPLTITDTNQVTYGLEEFGLYGPGLNALMQGVGGSTGIANILQGTGDAATAAGGPGAGQLLTDTVVGTGVQQALGLGAVGNAGQVATGLSPNQFFTILLKAPVYKSLTFQWYLVPRTFEESKTIRNIIRELNNAMAPGLGLGGAVFSFPMITQCAFMPNYNYLFRMKPAVIQDFSIDYAPGSVPSFYHEPQASSRSTNGDNPPESVKISITFQELEYWLFSDYKGDEAGPFNTTGDDRLGNSPGGAAAEEALRNIVSNAGNFVQDAVNSTGPGSDAASGRRPAGSTGQ